jgi:hypothetical protein
MYNVVVNRLIKWIIRMLYNNILHEFILKEYNSSLCRS